MLSNQNFVIYNSRNSFVFIDAKFKTTDLKIYNSRNLLVFIDYDSFSLVAKDLQ